MADTTILLNAYSIVGGPKLSVVNHGGNFDEGGMLLGEAIRLGPPC